MLHKKCSLLVDITNQLIIRIVRCIPHQYVFRAAYFIKHLISKHVGKTLSPTHSIGSLCPRADSASAHGGSGSAQKEALACLSQLTYLLESHKLILCRSAFVDLLFIPGIERGIHLDI